MLVLLWLAIAAVGVGLQLSLVLTGRTDLRVMRDMGWDAPESVMIARAHLRTARTRLVVVAVNVGIGVLALFPMGPRCSPTRAQVAVGTAVACALILNELQLVGSSFLDRRMRRRLAVMKQAPVGGVQ